MSTAEASSAETPPGQELRAGKTADRHTLHRYMSSRWVLGMVGIAIAAILFVVTALALSATAMHALENNTRAERAAAVTRECAELLRNLGEANVVARVMLTSDDPALAKKRANAIKAVHEGLGRLGGLVEPTPQILSQLKRAEEYTEKRITLYDQLIAHKKIAGGQDGLEPGRLTYTTASNSEISAMAARASLDFARYQQDVAKQMRLAVWEAIISGIASPLFGLWGIVLLLRDRQNQEAQELQRELMHVQRLAIMGETSAMLAHEINQPLTAAANYLSVLRRQIDPAAKEKTAPVLERIEGQIRRAAQILKKLRRFIDKRECERNLEAVDVLVDDAMTLLGTLDSAVSLKTEIASALPMVLVDRVQLQQVLVNLMRNAIEAMENQPRHELKLTVRAFGEGAIEVALADSGPGLPADVSARLFQPFVSTKAAGMGVGLSICHSIITQHGGCIWAESNPEGGTIFRFTLPAGEERAAA